MRKLAVLAGAAAAALVATSAAGAAGTSNVAVYGCYLAGGQTTRPANTELVARTGWAAKTRGLVRDFLEAQATTLTIDGGAPVDASSLYEEPAPRDTGDWAAFPSVPTGIVLAPGESVTLSFTITVSHRLTDGEVFANGEGGKPQFLDAGPFGYSCTVTGV
jgi:hypothetical protein